ncbi:MAG: MFS transporter [Gemmatimonadales bacterium]|nr:MAG: MFS transporter [Gemmatimonadales bacterium]
MVSQFPDSDPPSPVLDISSRPPAPQLESTRLKQRPAAWGALAHRNFRIFFAGQLVSLVGTWIGNTAQAWLVLVLTDSPFYVGLVAALGSLPVLLVSLYAGTVVDRVPKLKVIVATQTAAMLLAFALAGLVFAGVVTVGHIIAIALLLGIANAFDVPARQSFFVEMVGKEDLMSAIALNSSAFNLTRIIGPAVAGLLIGRFGVLACFVINGLSFLAVLAALWSLDLPPARTASRAQSTWGHMLEGIRFVTGEPRIAALVINLMALSIFGFPFLVLMPVMARDVLGRGAEAFGWMSSAVGVGALAGALLLAASARKLPKGKLLRWASLSFGVVVGTFALSRSLPLSLVLLALTGFAMIVNTATTNTLLQTLAPDHLRGRVVSVYTFAFVGMGPIGAFQAGFLADHIGAPATLMLGGAVCLLIAAAAGSRIRQLT